jgi:hypothetical protein
MNNLKRASLLLIYALLTSVLVFIIKPHYFYSLLIVLVPPTALNLFWINTEERKRILIFSVISLIFFAFPIELIARLNNIWDVDSIFFRPFGLIPFENMLFAFINFSWILSFDKLFFPNNKKVSSSFHHRYRILLSLYTFLSLTIYAAYCLNPAILRLNYLYLGLPIIFIPLLLYAIFKPSLFRDTLLTTIYFAVILFIYEFVSLKIGSWWWPAESYLFPIKLSGQTFPLDDVLLWYFASTPALLCGYRYFIEEQ